jgi:hypothetical protein
MNVSTGRDVLGIVAHHRPQVAQQKGLDRAIEQAEGFLIAALGGLERD